jgi:hypothetical protein
MGGIPLLMGNQWQNVNAHVIVNKLLDWNFYPFFKFEQLLPPIRFAVSLKVMFPTSRIHGKYHS